MVSSVEEFAIGQGIQFRGRTGTVSKGTYDDKVQVLFDDDTGREPHILLAAFVSHSDHAPRPLITPKGSRVQARSDAVRKGYDLFEDKPDHDNSKFNPDTCTDKEALDILVGLALSEGRIRITCSPSTAAHIVANVAGVLGCTTDEAKPYVEVQTEATHHAKFDVVIPNDARLSGFKQRLKLNLNTQGKSCKHFSEVQIGCRALAEHIMRLGLLPTQR